MTPSSSERFDLAVVLSALVLLAMYVALGTPLLGVAVALLAVGWIVSRAPAGDRVHLAVGSTATITVAGAAVPALVLDTNLSVGFDSTAQLWVAVAGSLTVLWLGLALLDRQRAE